MAEPLEKPRYRALFWSTFRLSACTFGGGYVIVPLMRKTFVEKLRWIDEGEMMDFTAIISVISLFYQAFRANPIVNLAMTGMLAGVAAVLCDVVYTMARSVLRPRKWVLPAVLMVLSFLAVAVGGWNPILVLLLCGGVGAVQLLAPRRKGKRGGQQP